MLMSLVTEAEDDWRDGRIKAALKLYTFSISFFFVIIAVVSMICLSLPNTL